ncbi:MAG: ABC transporter substrate-binding protein [Alphaproteobacteria bacterium]|nr:ABC transporter substrate-binding protein [Alphaproteobacteria bacterium]MCB9930740.1 ABC transporter substrate-binding protein [Alphaproteobacteria bacterium]
MSYLRTFGLAALATAGLAAAASTAQAKDLIIGMMCDRTGPTAVTGTALCPGYHDYIDLVNSKGGVMGNKIIADEVDIQYKVPPAIEAYQRYKSEGAVLVSPYGTPMTAALIKTMEEDKIAGTTAGFGTAAAANGEKYPYMFPIAASYWSQTAAAIKFAKDKLGGDLKGKKIAYIFYDNPAGREGIPVLEEIQKQEGYELRTFGVPAPGVEAGSQVLDVTRRYRADFVLLHVFGRAPAVVLKELKRAGYPMDHVIGYVWAVSEGDIAAAGGWDVVEGYNTIQFAGVGSDYPVLQEIRDMYKAEGKDEPEAMKYTVYYNRGVFQAAVHVKAIENAVKAKGSADITGTDVRDGMEALHGFTLGGLVPPLEMSRQDHEGGGFVQVFQVQKGKYVPVTDWFRAYRDDVLRLLAAEHQ